MNRWTPIEWSQALDGRDAQGVDTDALLSAWGTSTNPEDCRDPQVHDDWDEDDVILTDARHSWVLGVLAGEIEPMPADDQDALTSGSNYSGSRLVGLAKTEFSPEAAEEMRRVAEILREQSVKRSAIRISELPES